MHGTTQAGTINMAQLGPNQGFTRRELHGPGVYHVNLGQKPLEQAFEHLKVCRNFSHQAELVQQAHSSGSQQAHFSRLQQKDSSNSFCLMGTDCFGLKSGHKDADPKDINAWELGQWCKVAQSTGGVEFDIVNTTGAHQAQYNPNFIAYFKKK